MSKNQKPILAVAVYDPNGKEFTPSKTSTFSTVGGPKQSILGSVNYGWGGAAGIWEFHIVRYDGKGKPAVEIKRWALEVTETEHVYTWGKRTERKGRWVPVVEVEITTDTKQAPADTIQLEIDEAFQSSGFETSN